MEYPFADFLRDYQKWQKPTLPVKISTLPPEQVLGLLGAFFEMQYGHNSPIADYRQRLFRQILALLTNSRKQLAEAGFLVPIGTKQAALIPAPLLAAAHELVVERGIEQPTLGQVEEAMKRHGWPGKEAN